MLGGDDRETMTMMGRTLTATILFTDLVGSTELLARIGRQAADAVRVRHFAQLRTAIDAHDGREVKTLGDGVMARFASAGDALACAVTIQQAVERDGRRAGTPLGVRVGLALGDVTSEEDDVFGLAVVEASRLCAACRPGQVLAAESIRALSGGAGVALEPFGELELKGLPGRRPAWEVAWEPDSDRALRLALVDDAVMLRESIARALEAEGFEVVLQASSAENLTRAVVAARPDVVVLDIRMPPTHTDEGLRAAEHLSREHPELGLLILSQDLSEGAARRLLAARETGVGFLLKERVGDIAELSSAIRSIAGGATMLDPELGIEMTGSVPALLRAASRDQ